MQCPRVAAGMAESGQDALPDLLLRLVQRIRSRPV